MEGTEVRGWSRPRSADWSAAYTDHAPRLAAFLTKLTGDREVAADLMQETFVRVIRSHPDHASSDPIRPLLYRIAANLARDHHRRRQLLRFVPFTGSEPGPSGLPDPDTTLIYRALRALPAAQAATLLLHYDAGFSRSEIAAMEGITEEAVKSRLARGRERFIREFDRLGGRDDTR